MCNINMVFRKDGRKDKRLSEFMNLMSWYSFQNNNDGEGFINEKFKITKSVNKLIYSGSHKFIISHQRLTTSGRVPEMTQPLENDDYIIIHNGVFKEMGGNLESDTAVYLKKLSEKDKDNPINAIKEISKETFGSYSVVLYHKATGKLMYYKNALKDMYIMETEKYRFLSTIKENLDYMKIYLNEPETEVYSVVEKEIINLNRLDKWIKFDNFETARRVFYPPVKPRHLTAKDRSLEDRTYNKEVPNYSVSALEYSAGEIRKNLWDYFGQSKNTPSKERIKVGISKEQFKRNGSIEWVYVMNISCPVELEVEMLHILNDKAFIGNRNDNRNRIHMFVMGDEIPDIMYTLREMRKHYEDMIEDEIEDKGNYKDDFYIEEGVKYLFRGNETKYGFYSEEERQFLNEAWEDIDDFI